MALDSPKRFRPLKIIGFVLALLFVVIIALPFLLDANQFRSQFESKLAEALGREVRVGNLKLAPLSGSLSVHDISIADDPQFSRSAFVTAKSLKAGVELKPLLFSKEVRITGLSLDKPTIHLFRSASGKWNLSGLGGKGSVRSGNAPDAPITDVFIKELVITEGRVVSQEGQKRPVVYENVNLSASNLSFTTSFPFALNVSLPGEGEFRLEGEAGPLDRTDMIATPMKAAIAVSHFDLVASGFVPEDSGISGLIEFSGTANSDGRQVRSKGYATAESLRVVKAGVPAGKAISLDYSLDYNLEKRNGRLTEAKVQCGKAIALLSGSFNAAGDAVRLQMKLRGANMPVQDLTPLLPAFGVKLPEGASLQGGLMNVDLETEGSMDKLVTTGTADISNTRLAGFDLSGKLSSLAALSGVPSNQLTEIERFAANMKMSPEGIQVTSLQMTMPALGQLSGAGNISPDQSLDFTMRALLKTSGAIGEGVARLTGGNELNLPFFVRGTTADPKFVPDSTGAASGILESVLSGKESKSGASDGLGDTLRGLFKKK